MRKKVKSTRIENLLKMLRDELYAGNLSSKQQNKSVPGIGMPPLVRIREIATALETEYEIADRPDSAQTAKMLAHLIREIEASRQVEGKIAHSIRLIRLLNETEEKRKAGMWRTRR